MAHLAASQIKDSTPFETVLRALYSAWDAQEQRKKAQEAAGQQARQRAEQRAMLAERVAADIRKLHDIGNALPIFWILLRALGQTWWLWRR